MSLSNVSQSAAKMLRIGVVQRFHPSNVDRCGQENFTPRQGCFYPGAAAEILASILHRSGLPYQIVSYEDWQLMFNDIAVGMLDTAAFLFLSTPERQRLVDFSLPIEQIRPMFLVQPKKPSVVSNALLIFKALPLTLWLMFLCTLFVLIASIILLRKYSQQARTVWPLVRYCIDQCNEVLEESSWLGNMLLIVSGLMVVLLLNLFQGFLLTTLLHPIASSPFRDLDELIMLIERGEYRLIDSNNSYHSWMLEHSDDFYYTRLRKALQENPIKYVETVDNVGEMVNTGDFVYPSMHHDIIKDYLEQACPLTLIGHHPSFSPVVQLGFIFTPGSPLRELVDMNLIRLQGHIEKVLRKYAHQPDECNEKKPVKALSVPLLYGLFGIVLIGCLLALVACIFEVVWASKIHEYNVNDDPGETQEKTEDLQQSLNADLRSLAEFQSHIEWLEEWLSKGSFMKEIDMLKVMQKSAEEQCQNGFYVRP